MMRVVPNVPAWLVVNAAALAASLAHVLIDAHIGLFGLTSPIMSGLQAANILLICLVVGWWSLSLAAAHGGSRSALASALTLAIGWALLGNGAVFVLAPPPSDGFPYQDIAHFSSLIFGGWAAYTTWRDLKRRAGTVGWQFVGLGVVFMVTAFVLQSLLSLSRG